MSLDLQVAISAAACYQAGAGIDNARLVPGQQVVINAAACCQALAGARTNNALLVQATIKT